MHVQTHTHTHTYLGGTNKADGIEVFHGLPTRVRDQLKQVNLLLENLRLGINHAHDAGLRGVVTSGRCG